MTPIDRLVKAAHMALEREQRRRPFEKLDETHQIVIRLKPRGELIRATVTEEAVERTL